MGQVAHRARGSRDYRDCSHCPDFEQVPQGTVLKGAVLQQVLPRVSPSARNTIEGKIRVLVRVEVDPSGNVTDAKLVSAGPSKYFARLALESARDWKFTPA